LLSGHHKQITEWRNKNRQEKTQEKEKKYKNNNKIIPNPNSWRLSKIIKK
jgi:tRNA G37 N-methylase TrmD